MEVLDGAQAVYDKYDVILKVHAPAVDSSIGDKVAMLKSGTILIGFIWPAQNESLISSLAKQNITVLAMDSVPRLSRGSKA